MIKSPFYFVSGTKNKNDYQIIRSIKNRVTFDLEDDWHRQSNLLRGKTLEENTGWTNGAGQILSRLQ